MSVASIIEAIEYEESSCQPDEWLDLLIQVRDALNQMIEKEITGETGR